MRKYYLDYDKSNEVYENCKAFVEMKQCYNNVFNVVTDYINKFRSGEWKTAYGYVETMAGVFCRHCFIIDENGKVIDPTIHTNKDPNFDRAYLLVKEFDDMDEYLAAIEQEDYFPALDMYLAKETQQAQKRATKEGYILIG